MRLFTTLLLAVAAGLAVYAARRRLKLALTVAGVAFPVIYAVRLLFVGGEVVERFEELAWPALVLLALWLVLWQVSTRYERRKLAQRANRPRRGRR